MNTNLNIDDFGVLLADGTKDTLGEDYSVEYKEVIKNNGVVYHAIVIKKNIENIAPTIYIDELFREYLKGRKIKALTESVVQFYHRCGAGREVEVDFFKDFSKVCENLSFKVINLEKNQKMLSDVPYRQVVDLAMVPICNVKNRAIGSGNIMIHKRHLEMWEISEEELWENVFEYTHKASPVKTVKLCEFVSDRTGIPFEDYLDNVMVVTNKEMQHGASAAFYPGVLRGLAKDFDSDLVMIPSSVHETIVMPSYMAGTGEFTIAQMIREVNDKVVSDEEILSDNAYYYNRAEEVLSIFSE